MSLIDEIKSACGGEVVKATPGHGSFFELDIMRSDNHKITLWIYLSDWAIIRFDEVILSSGFLNKDQFKIIAALIGSMINHVMLADNHEVYIRFSGNYDLKIWENENEYGEDARMIRVYLDDAHIGDYPLTEFQQ